MNIFTPGMCVLCRDAKWLVARVESSSDHFQEQVIYCVGTDELIRSHEAVFLTQLDRVTQVDPRRTKLVSDDSGSYSRAKMSAGVQLPWMLGIDTSWLNLEYL